MIEVLLAITIFSVVAVAGLTIMNQGAAAAQRSLEVTLVRNEMDAQAETLRLLYDEAMSERSLGKDAIPTTDDGSALYQWGQVLAKRQSSVSDYSSIIADGGQACIDPSDLPSGAFIMNPRTADTVEYSSSVWVPAPLYSRILYTDVSDDTITTIAGVEGIWIEAERHSALPGGPPGYTDFHIRACWTTVGQAMPVTLGTIVRLYEP